MEYEKTLDKLKEETNEAMAQLGRLRDPYADIGQGNANKRHHHHHKHENEGASKITSEVTTKSGGPDPYADVGGDPARRRRRRSLEIGSILPNRKIGKNEESSSAVEAMSKKELYAKVAKDPYATLGLKKRGKVAVSSRRSAFDQSPPLQGIGGLTLITHPTKDVESKSTVDSTASALEQITTANQLAPKEAPGSPHSLMLDSLPKFKEALLKINPDTRKRLFEMKPFRFLANMPNFDEKEASSNAQSGSNTAESSKPTTAQTFNGGHDPYADMGNAVARSKTKYNKNKNSKPLAGQNKDQLTKSAPNHDPYAEVGASSSLPSKRGQTTKPGTKKSSDPFSDIGHGGDSSSITPLRVTKKTEKQTKKSKSAPKTNTNKITHNGKIKSDPFADIGSKRQNLASTSSIKNFNNNKQAVKKATKRNPFADIGSATKRSHFKRSKLMKNKNKNNKRSRLLKHKKNQKRENIPSQIAKKKSKQQASKRDPFADIGSVSSQRKRSKTQQQSHKTRKIMVNEKRSKSSLASKKMKAKYVKIGTKREEVSSSSSTSQKKQERDAKLIHVVSENMMMDKGNQFELFEGSEPRDGERMKKDDGTSKQLEEQHQQQKVSYAKDPYKSIGKVIFNNPHHNITDEDKEESGKEDSKKKNSKSKEFASDSNQEGFKELTGDQSKEPQSSGQESSKELADVGKDNFNGFAEGQGHVGSSNHLLAHQNTTASDHQNVDPDVGHPLEVAAPMLEKGDSSPVPTISSNHIIDPYAEIGESSRLWGDSTSEKTKSKVSEHQDKSSQVGAEHASSNVASNSTQNIANSTASVAPKEDAAVRAPKENLAVPSIAKESTAVSSTAKENPASSPASKEDPALKQEVSFASSVLQKANDEEKVDFALAKTEDLLRTLNQSNNQIKNEMTGKMVKNQTADPYANIRDNLPAIKQALLRATEATRESSQKEDTNKTLTEAKHEILSSEEQTAGQKPEPLSFNKTTNEQPEEFATSKKQQKDVKHEAPAHQGPSNFKKVSNDPYLEVGSSPLPNKRTTEKSNSTSTKQTNSTTTASKQTQQSSSRSTTDPYLEIGETISTTVAGSKRSTPTSPSKKRSKKGSHKKRSRRSIDDDLVKKSPKDCTDPYTLIGQPSIRSDPCLFTQSQNKGNQGHLSGALAHDPYTDIGSKRHIKNKRKAKRSSGKKNWISRRTNQRQSKEHNEFTKLKEHNRLRKDPYADIGKRRNHVNRGGRKDGKRVYLPPNPAISNDEEKLISAPHSINQAESSPVISTNGPVLQEVSPHQESSTDQPAVQEVTPNQLSAQHHMSTTLKQQAKKKGKLVKDPYSDIGKKRQNINKEKNLDEDASRALQRSLDGLSAQVGDDVNSNLNKTTVIKSLKGNENKSMNATESTTEKLLKDPYLFIGSAADERKRSSVDQNKRSFDPYADLGTSIGLTQNEAHEKSKKAVKSEAKTITPDSSGSQHLPLSGVARSLDEHGSEAKKIGDEVGAFTSASQSHIGPHDTSDPYNDLKSLKDVDPKKNEDSTKLDEHKELLTSPTVMKTGEMEKAFQVTNNVAKELKTIANIEREIASEKSKTPDTSVTNELEMNVGKEIKGPYIDIGAKKRTLTKKNTKKNKNIKCSQRSKAEAARKLNDPYMFIGSAAERRQEVLCDEDAPLEEQQDHNLEHVLQSADPSNEEFSKLEDKSPANSLADTMLPQQGEEGKEENKEETKEENKEEGKDAPKEEAPKEEGKEDSPNEEGKEDSPNEEGKEDSPNEEGKEDSKNDEGKEESKNEEQKALESHEEPNTNESTEDENKEKESSTEKMAAKEEAAKMAAKLAEAAYASISGGANNGVDGAAGEGKGDKESNDKTEEKEGANSEFKGEQSNDDSVKGTEDKEAGKEENKETNKEENGESKPESNQQQSGEETATPNGENQEATPQQLSNEEENNADSSKTENNFTEQENLKNEENNKENPETKADENKESTENIKEKESTETKNEQETLEANKSDENKETTTQGAESEAKPEDSTTSQQALAGESASSQEAEVDPSKESSEKNTEEAETLHQNPSPPEASSTSAKSESDSTNSDMTDYLMGRLTSDSTGTPVASSTSNNKKKGREARPKTRHHSKPSSQSLLEQAYASTGTISGKKKHGLTKRPKKKTFRDPYADMGQSTRSAIPKPESEKGRNNLSFLKVQNRPSDDDVTLTL